MKPTPMTPEMAHKCRHVAEAILHHLEDNDLYVPVAKDAKEIKAVKEMATELLIGLLQAHFNS